MADGVLGASMILLNYWGIISQYELVVQVLRCFGILATFIAVSILISSNVAESDINVPRKWSYKTSSPIFQKRFKEAVAAVEEILNREEGPFVTDLGVTTFTVTYADKAKATRNFILPGDEFKECFAIIKQMVPGCEYVPAVLLTSEDYTDGDEV